MKTLTDKQAEVILAFVRSFENRTTGAWAQVEAGMREDFGIEDPEAALEDALSDLED